MAKIKGSGAYTAIEVKVRGRVIARVLPDEDRQALARKYLRALRKNARIGDILSPSGETWDAEQGRY